MYSNYDNVTPRITTLDINRLIMHAVKKNNIECSRNILYKSTAVKYAEK